MFGALGANELASSLGTGRSNEKGSVHCCCSGKPDVILKVGNSDVRWNSALRMFSGDPCLELSFLCAYVYIVFYSKFGLNPYFVTRMVAQFALSSDHFLFELAPSRRTCSRCSRAGTR